MSRRHFDMIKLHFDSPLHIGRGQTGSYDVSKKIIRSDTLKAALFAVGIQLLGEEMGDDEEDFHKKFKVSSAFPYKGDMLFFPKPMVKLPVRISGQDEVRASKTMKKIQYIDREMFESVLNGQSITASVQQLASTGQFLTSQPLPEDFTLMRSDVQQKVYISQNPGEDPLPYYIDRIYFERDAGLFFLLETADETVKQKIMHCLNLLGDEGIGSDRNVGNGTFSYTTGQIAFDLPDQHGCETNLSLYLPRKEELNKEDMDKSAYQLIKRGGYIAGTTNPEFLSLRKRSIYMMTEGSVFPVYPERIGKIENLQPDYEGMHNIWRDGQSVFLPIKLTES